MPPGLEKIDHFVFIVQENRSFDHYFGTYPGADGIPKAPGGGFAASTCNPHPVLKGCMKPYHSSVGKNRGGPHGREASDVDIAGGKMTGFIEGVGLSPNTRRCVLEPLIKACKSLTGPKHQPDAMSYKDRRDIPEYWAMADWGVLQDRLFASVDSYSLPAHQFILSGWAASCDSGPMSCTSDPTPNLSNFAWTPITYLLDEAGVDWAWYVGENTNVCENYPNCPQERGTPYSSPNWNAANGFTTIIEGGLHENILPVSSLRESLANDTLPAVSWVIPAQKESEHPGNGSMMPGPQYVKNLVNDIGASSSWDSTAVFVYWDDWGGFYDHVRPPQVDTLGYGIRVPGIMLSPYAKEGMIDHQTLSFEAFLVLIQNRFLDGARLDPATMSRPDSRPSVRENEAILGDLMHEFDFDQVPREPPVIP